MRRTYKNFIPKDCFQNWLVRLGGRGSQYKDTLLPVYVFPLLRYDGLTTGSSLRIPPLPSSGQGFSPWQNNEYMPRSLTRNVAYHWLRPCPDVKYNGHLFPPAPLWKMALKVSTGTGDVVYDVWSVAGTSDGGVGCSKDPAVPCATIYKDAVVDAWEDISQVIFGWLQ